MIDDDIRNTFHTCSPIKTDVSVIIYFYIIQVLYFKHSLDNYYCDSKCRHGENKY